MDNFFADCVTSPPCVREVCQGVVKAGKNGHGYLSYFFKRIQVCGSFLVSVEKVLVVVCKYLEAVLSQVLGIVENCFHGSSVWVMTHVDCKSVSVV